MKRLLSFSAAALLVPVVAIAQDGAAPATLIIAAPQNYVVAARTLPLNVRAVNGRGALLRGRSFAWSVSDPGRARIDDSGVLSGISPGAVEVSVTDLESGATGSRRYFVYPASIGIDQADVTIQQGDKVKLSAIARDADGKTVAGVPFQWHSDIPAIASISADGVVTGNAEGRITATAALDLGPEFTRFAAYVAVRIGRRTGFKLRPILSSEPGSARVTTLVPTRVAAAGNRAAALSSLSNGGQALLLWQDGLLQTLSTTGATINGRVVASFNSLAINDRGDVAVLANVQAEWCEQIVALFPAGSRTPVILDNQTRCSYGGLMPNALGSQRELVYRYDNTLYLRKADGSRQAILTVGDRPQGIGAVSNINNWSIAPSGKILIEMQDGNGASGCLMWDGAKWSKLIMAGDAVGPNTAQSIGLPVEVAPDEYVARIGGNSWSSISRLKAGAWTILAVNGRNDLGWIHGPMSASGGSIYFYADRSGKTALFRSNGTAFEALGTYANWRELTAVSALSGDSAIAYGTFDEGAPKAIRFTGTSSSVIFGPGLAIEGTAGAGIAQSSIPKGINPAGMILRTSGDTLLRAAAAGLSTVLKPGDRLPNGVLGGLVGMSANRLGDVALIARHNGKTGLYALVGGQVQAIADAEDRIGRANSVLWDFGWSDSHVAMNNAGRVAATTNTSLATGLFLYSGANSAANAELVVFLGDPVPGTSARFTGINQMAIDESNRVAFVANTTAGRLGLFLWERGAIRQIFELGQPDPNGRAYQGIQNLQAAGARFYLRVSVAGMNEVISVDGSTVSVLAYEGYVTSFGTRVTNFFGAELAANSRGDVVIPVLTGSGPMLLVRKADGTDTQVAAADTRGPDGEWFLNLYGAGISEQGDVTFAAEVWSAGRIRLGIYQASVN